MKRSTSRFKRSPFIKRVFHRDNLPFTLAVMTMFVVVSCQLSRHPEHNVGMTGEPVHADNADATAVAARSAADQTVGGGDEDDTQTLRLLTAGPAPRDVGALKIVSCDAATPLELTLHLTSAFGDAVAAARFAGEDVRVTIESAVMNFPSPTGLAAALRQHACPAVAPGESPEPTELTEVTLAAEQIEKLRELVEHVAPDCERLEPAATVAGFTCQLPGVEAEAAKQELVGIQTTMIRRWSRQPYLLARRLAVGVTLAQALQSNDVEKSLDTFCRLVKSSLPNELPATLASKRWQQAACGAAKTTDSGARTRIDVARFGLAKTVGEIDVMRQLFERTSRLGHLALRIPTSELAGRRVLISLAPEADVAENLARETARLYAAEPATPAATPAGVAVTETITTEDAPRSCWHPVYSETPDLFALARQLALAGEADQLSCSGPEKTTPTTVTTPDVPRTTATATAKMALADFVPQRYFAESITSETEFVVTNGRAKTLRLPMGHYSYTVRVLPDDPGSWDDASQVTPRGRGTIAWDAKRPHAVIADW